MEAERERGRKEGTIVTQRGRGLTPISALFPPNPLTLEEVTFTQKFFLLSFLGDNNSGRRRGLASSRDFLKYFFLPQKCGVINVPCSSRVPPPLNCL